MTKQIKKLLDQWVKGTFSVDEQGFVNVTGDVNIMDFTKRKLPFKFGKVSGDFWCRGHEFSSLEGFPIEVGGNFDCSGALFPRGTITSLVGCPQKVGGRFDCSWNQIKSLIGSPKKISGDYDCSYNKLTSLQYCPDYVGGDFDFSWNKISILDTFPKFIGEGIDCSGNKFTTFVGFPKEINGSFNCSDNKLISLEGCPEKIDGDFYCSNNKLKSLVGGPKIVSNSYYCSDNKLISLEGCPEKVDGDFYCSNNKLKSLVGGPKIVSDSYYCSDNKLISLEGCPEKIDGNFDRSLNPNLKSLEHCPKYVGQNFKCFAYDNFEKIERFTKDDVKKHCDVAGKIYVNRLDYWIKRGSYKIDKQGFVNVLGSVVIEWDEVKILPIKFGKVSGDFTIKGVSSLVGCPHTIGGDFCVFEFGYFLPSTYELKVEDFDTSEEFEKEYDKRDAAYYSLDGCPKDVGGDFFYEDCYWDKNEIKKVCNVKGKIIDSPSDFWNNKED